MPERARRWAYRVGVALLGLGAVYYLWFAGEYSVRDVRQMARERDQTAARIDSLRARTDSILRRVDSLATDPLTIERVAREEQGLLREGDRVYRFVAPADGAEPARGKPVSGGLRRALPKRQERPDSAAVAARRGPS